MLAPILPIGIACCEGPILKEGWNVTPEELAIGESFSPSRKAEFLTGRSYAKEAGKQLGFSFQPLLANPDRSPIWPQGQLGCISHSKDYCAVAVADSAQYSGIGLDIESIGRISMEISKRVFTPDEQAAIADYSEAERTGVMSAMFCAKEAFYKLQYPMTHAWVGFQDVMVRISSQNQFCLVLLKEIPQGFPLGQEFTGKFLITEAKAAAFLATRPTGS